MADRKTSKPIAAILGLVGFLVGATLLWCFAAWRGSLRDNEDAIAQMGVVASAISTYYDDNGTLPPADFDYSNSFRSLGEEKRITQVRWSGRIRPGFGTAWKDHYLQLTVRCISRRGIEVFETFDCPVKQRSSRWVWHMRWHRPGDWDTERQCADGLAQMVFRYRQLYGRWPSVTKDLRDAYLFSQFAASIHGRNLSFRFLPSKLGSGEIVVLSTATKLAYRYSVRGPDYDDTVLAVKQADLPCEADR